MNFHLINEFSPNWLFLIVVLDFCQHNQFLSHSLPFNPSKKFHQIDTFSSRWWNFITVMNFHQTDEFSSNWWICIILMIFISLILFDEKIKWDQPIFSHQTIMTFHFGLNDSFSKGKLFNFIHHNGWICSAFSLMLTYSSV